MKVFAVCLLVFLVGLGSVGHYHRDEANWIAVGAWSFRTAFVERDFDDPGWFERYWTFGCPNPQVGKYLIGAALWLSGRRDYGDVELVQWERGQDVEWHIERGLVPDGAELYAARLPSAVMAAGTAALVYLLASLTLGGSWAAGALAALAFVAHPLVIMLGRRAMLDMPAAFFGTLAVTLAVGAGLALARGTRGRAVLLVAGAALAAGLGISVKMNAVLGWMAALAVWGLAAAFYLRDRRALAVWLIGLALLVALPPVVFIGSNPYLWPDVGGVHQMLELSEVVASYQRNNPAAALDTLGEKVGAFADLSFPFPWTIFTVAAAELGLFFLMSFVILRRGEVTAFISAALLAWAVILCAGTLLWSPLAWGRYYLPAAPALAVLEGVGVVGLVVVPMRRLWFR